MTAAPGLIRMVKSATPTSTGIVNFTSPGLGTCKGAMIFVIAATTSGTVSAGSSMSRGYMDGTNQRAAYFHSQDNVGTSGGFGGGSTVRCVRLYDPAFIVTTLVEAQFSSFVTDGVAIDFTKVHGSNAYKVVVVLFGGTQCEVAVGDGVSNADGTANTQSVAFEAEFVITDWMRSNGDNVLREGGLAVGVAANDGVDSNGFSGTQHGSNLSTQETRSVRDQVRCAQQWALSTGMTPDVSLGAVIVDNYTGSGFDIRNPVLVSTSPRISWMAVTFAGAMTVDFGFDLAELTPTVTGNESKTTGHETGFLLIGLTRSTGVSKVQGAAACLGMTDFREEASFCVMEETDVSTTNSGSYYEDKVLSLIDDDVTTLLVEAGIVSQDSSGYTLDFTTVDASTRSYYYLSIQETVQTVEPTGVGTGEIVGAHTVTPSGPTVQPPGTASGELFGSHTVVPGGVAVSPSAIGSLELFGSHLILPQGVTILPPSIGSLEALGNPTLQSLIELFPTSIASGEAFATLVVLPGGVIIDVDGITSEEAFGAHSLLATINILPTAIAVAEAFGVPVIVQTADQVISPEAIASAEALGSVVVIPEGGGYVDFEDLKKKRRRRRRAQRPIRSIIFHIPMDIGTDEPSDYPTVALPMGPFFKK